MPTHLLGDRPGCTCRNCDEACIRLNEAVSHGVLPPERLWNDRIHREVVMAYRLLNIMHDLDKECLCTSCAAAESIRNMYK